MLLILVYDKRLMINLGCLELDGFVRIIILECIVFIWFKDLLVVVVYFNLSVICLFLMKNLILNMLD